MRCKSRFGQQSQRGGIVKRLSSTIALPYVEPVDIRQAAV
jgi:hypothetical protein